MKKLEALRRAVERGYFVADDTGAIGGDACLLKADWDIDCEDGFQRIEVDMDDDDPPDFKSRVQEMGLWVDYISPHCSNTRFRLTIPPAREVNLNYQGLVCNPEPETLTDPPRAQRRRGILFNHRFA